MSRFKHSHVMGLLGVCLDAGSAPFIVMPYMANGSLLKYLKKERKNIVLSEEDDEDEVSHGAHGQQPKFLACGYSVSYIYYTACMAHSLNSLTTLQRQPTTCTYQLYNNSTSF